jgi:hypothetical protein
MSQPRVFVSHASADAQFANHLADDLRASGADVWLDSSHMGAGDFVAHINNALASREFVVLVLTPASIQSPWVSQEFNAAIARTQQGLMRPPIVVMAQPCKPADVPPLWTVYHRYDAANDYPGAVHGVARELGLSTPTSGQSAPVVALPVAVSKTSASRRAPADLAERRISMIAWMSVAGAALLLAAFVWGTATNGFLQDPAGELWSLVLLLIGAVLLLGSWGAACIRALRQKRWGWLATLVVAFAVGLGFNVLELHSPTPLLTWSIFPCAFTLVAEVMGSTRRARGKA